MSQNDYATIAEVRIAVVGDVGAGKSALAVSFVQNNFLSNYDPTV